MLRELMLVSLLLGGPAGCGGTEKPLKPLKQKDDQKTASALLKEARQSAADGEIDDADKAYKEAFELGKKFEVLEERVDFLIHAGKATRAQEAARGYYDDNSTNIKAYQLYAEALLAGNNGKDALKVADEMIALNAEDPSGHEKKGRALILLERSDEGFEALRKAVQLDPENGAYQLSLGLALYNAKKIDAAALAFRAAMKRSPDDAKAHVYLGMALRDQDELDEAKAQLDKALELDADNGRAYFELGLLYNKQGKQADAEQALSKAVQKSPNESLFWYAYGEIYRLQSRVDDAISAYRKAINLDPPYPKAITKLGIVLIERGEYEEAERLLIAGANREPKNPANHLGLGDLYVARRKPKDAVFYYEKYLEYAPKNDRDRARVRELLPELKRRR